VEVRFLSRAPLKKPIKNIPRFQFLLIGGFFVYGVNLGRAGGFDREKARNVRKLRLKSDIFYWLRNGYLFFSSLKYVIAARPTWVPVEKLAWRR